MSYVLSLIALVGATILVVRGTIFRPIQLFYPALFRCSQCAGFWVGVTASPIIHTGHGLFLNAAIVGASVSFLSLLADAVLLKLLGDPD
jgi:hypothetical protein